MSLQIIFQKTNKNSYTKDRLVIRRHSYDPELKKTIAGKVIFSCNKYKLPDELPSEKLEAFNVTEEEHKQYKDLVTKMRDDNKKESIKTKAYFATEYIQGLADELEARSDGFPTEEIEKLEVEFARLRKQITRHKTNAKRRKK